MKDIKPHNHLIGSFYTTPRFAHQAMTLKQWQETILDTGGFILSIGETWELTHRYLGGGMREVRAIQTYWKDGKPVRVKREKE